MALENDLFANPTTGESDFGATKLKDSQRAFKNLAPQMGNQTEELKKVISDFTTRKSATPQTNDIDLSNILSEFGATDYSEPSAGDDGGIGGFIDATYAAADKGFADVGFGMSLISNDTDTNMLAAEQKYQKSLGEPPKRLGYDKDSWSKLIDADWWGNLAGGTMPSIAGLVAGGGAGAVTGSVVPGFGTAVAGLTGAAGGSGGAVGLQQLGGTFKDAFASYRNQGKSVKESYNLAYDVAKVDALKSGALASAAVLLTPLRVTGSLAQPIGYGATTFGVGGAKKLTSRLTTGQLASQAVQQTLILQPSLEVADVISSNVLAKNSFDKERDIYDGAVDAAIGSIFFDFPTTSAGLAYTYARSGKYKAPFSTDLTTQSDETITTEQEVLDPEGGELSIFEGDTTNTGTIVDLDPSEFKDISDPENASNRASFLANQITRMEEYDISKRQDDDYKGDVRVSNTVNFFKWLGQGDRIIAEINSIKDVAVRNNADNQRKLGDAQERVMITKIMMNPMKNVVVPRYVFQTANGKVFRVVLSKNGNPLSPFQKSGKPQKTHITVFDPSSKTGTRSIAKSSGTLSSSGVPVPKNILLTADVYSRLINARNRMLAEMDEADAFDAANRPQDQLTQTEQTPKEPTARQAEAQEKIETAAEGQTSSDVIPVTQDNATQPNLPFNQTQTTETQTGTQYFADPESGQYDMNQGFDFSTRPEQDQVIDQAEAETEVEYTQKTTKPRLPDGSIDTMSSPITSLSDGKNTLYTSRSVGGIDSSIAWYQVDVKGFNLDTPAYSIPIPIGNNKAEAIETLKNKLAQMSDNQTVKFARTQNIKTNDAVQRAGELPLGEGIEGLLTNVPGKDKPAVRQIINMFAKTLDKNLEKVDVVNLASYLNKMDIDPDIADGMIGAYIRGWIKQTEGNLQRGAIAIRLNQQPSTRVESLAHELVHFGIKMKNITPEMMVDMYNSIPDTDFNKQFIENDPYYKDLTIADRAEEYIAFTLGEMVENRYRGPITRRSGEYENKVQYFIRQIIRAVREFFERLTGKNLVDDYLNNIKTKYGMDTEANNPFEDQTAVYGRVRPVPDNRPDVQEQMNIENPLAGGNYIDLDIDNNADRDVTGKTYTGVEIAINERGIPSMVTSDVEAKLSPPEVVTGKIGKAVNLVNPSKKAKKRTMWEWTDRDNDTDPIHTLVTVTSTNNLSIENGGNQKVQTPSGGKGDHQYALKVNMNGATKLATFPDSSSQPRLRPVMYASNVELGPIVGNIVYKGRDKTSKPVYEYITLSDSAQDTTPLFARKTDGTGTPSRNIEDIQKAIPEYQRATVQKAPNTVAKTINGERFTDLDLTQRGIGYVGKKSVADIWAETLDKVPGAKAELEKLGLTNKMVPREQEFWNDALKLPDRARYWYEVSSEVVGNYFPDMTSTEIETFWDVVAATSPMADPIDNMYRTIALLSEHYQGKPITTDLVSPTAVTTALSDEFLGAPKTRSFSGTFLYLGGIRNEVPLSTNDRQVASSFGITGDDIANNYVMYHILSEFYIKIRNEQNANLPAGVQPYETWQIQAPAWVHERGLSKVEKNEVQNYDDYALVLQNRVLPKLKEAGVSIPNDKLTKQVLRDPKVPYALRDNLLGYQEAFVGTVGVDNQSNVVSKQFEEIKSFAKDKEGFVGLNKEADKIDASYISKITARSRDEGKKQPSFVDMIASVMRNRKTTMVRVTTDGMATSNGFTKPNIRVPMRYKDSRGYGNFDAKDIDTFMTLLGMSLRQEKTTAGIFSNANLNEPAPEGFERTFSVFLETTEIKSIPDNVMGQLSNTIGRTVSVTPRANGIVFDIHLDGGPALMDETSVSNAISKTDLSKYGSISIIPKDYKLRSLEKVATPDSQGYNKTIGDFKKGIINEAVQKISDLHPRIGKGQARAYLIGNIEQIPDIPSAVQKRAERIRIGSRDGINNLNEVLDRGSFLFNKYKANQKSFIKKYAPKMEKAYTQDTLVPDTVNTEEDVTPVFARSQNPKSSFLDTEKNQIRLEKISANTGYYTRSARRIVGLGRGTPTAYKLANILDRDQYARTSRTETGIIEMDVHEEINQGLGKYTRQFQSILNNMTTAQIKLVPDLLRGKFVNPTTGNIQITPEMRQVGLTIDKARDLRKLMNDLYGLIEQTYGKYGAPPPPKILMYFPQVYTLGDGKFKTGPLKGMDKTNALTDFFTKVFIDDGATSEAAREKADGIVRKINNEGNAPIWGFDLSVLQEEKVYSYTPQELKRIINMNPYQVFDVPIGGGITKKMKLEDFLDNDTYGVIQKYITTTVRRMAFVNRFGVRGEKISEAVDEGGLIDQELMARKEKKLNKTDRAKIIFAIKANLGTLPTKSFFGATDSDFWYSVQSGTRAFGNLILLNASAILAVAEPLFAFQRLGVMGGLVNLHELMKNTLKMPYRMAKTTGKAAFTKGTIGDKYRAFQKAYDADDTDLQIFAKDIGTIYQGFQYAYQNAAEVNASIPWEKFNSVIFKTNLLQPVTDATRVAALKAAMITLPHWARKAKKGSETYKRYLQEVGLVPEDLDFFDPSNPFETSNPKIRAAFNDIVGSIIIAPNPGAKPSWMSDPRFALLSHIKTWTNTFTNTIIQRNLKELFVNKNPTPLLLLIGAAAGISAVSLFREWVTYGEEGNPYLNQTFDKEDDAVARFIYNMFERGGLFGIFQPIADFVVGSKYGRQDPDPADSMFPTYNILRKILTIVSGLTQASTTDDRERAKGIRRAVDQLTRLVPLLNVSGQLRKDFVDSVAPKVGRKKSNKSFNFNFNTKAFGGNNFKSFGN